MADWRQKCPIYKNIPIYVLKDKRVKVKRKRLSNVKVKMLVKKINKVIRTTNLFIKIKV